MALTNQAAKLGRKIEATNAKLEHAPAVVNADPQALTLSQLTGFSVDTSATLYAFLFSIALETTAMFAMVVAYRTAREAADRRTAGCRARQAHRTAALSCQQLFARKQPDRVCRRSIEAPKWCRD
jgi:hypothetical protein